MKHPLRLYKYQSFSLRSLENLKNNCIYFNDPQNFNDPYDTSQPIDLIELNYKNLVNLIFENSGISTLDYFIKLEKDTITTDELTRFVIFITQNVPDIYVKILKFLKTNKVNFKTQIKIIINSSKTEFIKLKDFLKQELKTFLNRQMVITIEKFKKEYVQKRGISCFSEKVDDLLMWSYYADGHKGFCLEYNTEYEPFQNVFKVNYVKSIPKVDLSELLINQDKKSGFVEKFLGTKFVNWSHEKEWRAFHLEKNKEYILKPNALSGVYFGTKMNFTDLEIICLIVKGQNPNVKFYRMKKVEGEFKVIPEEINYLSFQEAKNIVFNQIKEKLINGNPNIDEMINSVRIAASKEQIRALIEAIKDDIKLQNCHN